MWGKKKKSKSKEEPKQEKLGWKAKEFEDFMEIALWFSELEDKGYVINNLDIEWRSGTGVWYVLYKIDKG